MTAAAAIEIRADDLQLVARALCQADGDTAAPCQCRGGPDCAALDVYGDQARKVLAVLEATGRLAGSPPRLTAELVEGFFAANARRRGFTVPEPCPHGTNREACTACEPLARIAP